MKAQYFVTLKAYTLSSFHQQIANEVDQAANKGYAIHSQSIALATEMYSTLYVAMIVFESEAA